MQRDGAVDRCIFKLFLFVLGKAANDSEVEAFDEKPANVGLLLDFLAVKSTGNRICIVPVGIFLGAVLHKDLIDLAVDVDVNALQLFNVVGPHRPEHQLHKIQAHPVKGGGIAGQQRIGTLDHAVGIVRVRTLVADEQRNRMIGNVPHLQLGRIVQPIFRKLIIGDVFYDRSKGQGGDHIQNIAFNRGIVAGDLIRLQHDIAAAFRVVLVLQIRIHQHFDTVTAAFRQLHPADILIDIILSVAGEQCNIPILDGAADQKRVHIGTDGVHSIGFRSHAVIVIIHWCLGADNQIQFGTVGVIRLNYRRGLIQPIIRQIFRMLLHHINGGNGGQRVHHGPEF